MAWAPGLLTQSLLCFGVAGLLLHDTPLTQSPDMRNFRKFKSVIVYKLM